MANHLVELFVYEGLGNYIQNAEQNRLVELFVYEGLGDYIRDYQNHLVELEVWDSYVSEFQHKVELEVWNHVDYIKDSVQNWKVECEVWDTYVMPYPMNGNGS